MTTTAGRVEAWEFLLGGGAVYSNLNHAYQVEDPAGRGRPESEQFKQYMAALKRFMEQYDFVRMRQDRTVVAAGVPEKSLWRAISEPGRQYAIYIHHSSYAEGRRSYAPSDRPATLDLEIDLPRGSYRVEWIAPATGAVMRSDLASNHPGGRLKLELSPQHTADIALRLKPAK
jgi:hypothetical protein